MTGHSSETALLKVLSDILLGIDAGDLAALVLLDLSAAFDTQRIQSRWLGRVVSEGRVKYPARAHFQPSNRRLKQYRRG